MANQIDIKPLKGRRLVGFVAGRPVLGDDQKPPVDLILLNGVQIGTSGQDATSPVFLTGQLSPADTYAIQMALAKHHKTTKQKQAIRPINYGHQPKRSIDPQVREALQRRYRRR